MRRVQRKVGLGQQEPAVIRVLSLHTTTVNVPTTWSARQGLSTLGMATSFLLSSKFQCGINARTPSRKEDVIHWRFLE
ncbi:hypothetical protein HAX54_021704 [Datura stramonium]|uniref:Uncharacterized protein n=1 Tax=Datura stramonium TaxID=4076 RepID=A0ABS8UT51_DATST|nr:hypothetical protein [Datura stramonium]